MNMPFARNAYRDFLLWGILSSLGVTVSTLIDALLIGNLVGNEGLAVANMATPVFLVFSLFGLTIGVGANVQIGRMLGASRVEEANRLFRSQVAVGLGIGVLCLIVPLFFRDAFFRFLGVNDEVYPLAQSYITIVLYAAPIFILYNLLSVSVRTDSDPKVAAAASAAVILTDLSLDLLFMQGLGWGMLGASLSLCIAEFLGILILMTHFFKKRSLLQLQVSRPNLADIREFTVNGFGIGSALIFQAMVMLVFNTLLLRSGGENGVIHVAIFGVIYTVGTIPFALFDGTSNALSAVTAIFVGEMEPQSVLTVRRQGLRIVVLAGLLMAGLCALFARPIVRVFGLSDPETLKTAVLAIRIFAVSTVFTGINTLITAFWQVIGRAKLAGAMSVVRNCLLILALGSVLIPRWQIYGLSLAYVCSEALCTLSLLVVSSVRGSDAYVTAHYSPTGRCFESQYVIETQSVERMSADIDKLCAEWDIGPKQAMLINLILEELLLNIIKFGLQDSRKESYIALKVIEKDGDYVLRIRDNVRTYNPFECDGDAIDAGALKLILKKTKLCRYQRKLVFNYLYLIV